MLNNQSINNECSVNLAYWVRFMKVTLNKWCYINSLHLPKSCTLLNYFCNYFMFSIQKDH